MIRQFRTVALIGMLLVAAPLALGQAVAPRAVTDVDIRATRERNRQYSGAQIDMYAQKLKQEEQDLGIDDKRAAVTRGIYLRLLEESGRVDELVPLLEAEIERATKQEQPLQTREQLRLRIAQVLRVDGQIDKALAIYNALITEAEKEHGKNSTAALAKMQALAEAHVMMAKPAAAVELYEQIVARWIESKEKPTPATVGYRLRLAQLLDETGKRERAITAYQDALVDLPTAYGEKSIYETIYLREVARLNDALGRYDEAIRVSQRIVEADAKREGDDGETVQWSRIGLGAALQRVGKHDEAIEQYDLALAKLKTKVGGDDSKMLAAKQYVASGYEGARRFADAEPLRRECLELTERTAGKDSPAAASALAQLGLNLLLQEKWGDAATVLEPCLAIRKMHATENWLTFSTMSMLGGALLNQKKYDEAEPLLIDGVAGLEAQANQIPAAGIVRYREAIERVVKLYQATDRPKLAADWRVKLQALESPSK